MNNYELKHNSGQIILYHITNGQQKIISMKKNKVKLRSHQDVHNLLSKIGDICLDIISINIGSRSNNKYCKYISLNSGTAESQIKFKSGEMFIFPILLNSVIFHSVGYSYNTNATNIQAQVQNYEASVVLRHFNKQLVNKKYAINQIGQCVSSNL